MAVCTAVRYRNDMSVFDHHTDGVVRSAATQASKHALPPLPPSAGHRKNFSASQVMSHQLLVSELVTFRIYI